MEQLLAISVTLAVLGASLWLLRKRGAAAISFAPRRKQAGVMTTLDCLPLAPGHTLHLVRVADKAILIATSPGGCRALESMPWEDL